MEIKTCQCGKKEFAPFILGSIAGGCVSKGRDILKGIGMVSY